MVGIRRYFGIEQDVSGCNRDVCASRNLESGGEGQVADRDTIEGY